MSDPAKPAVPTAWNDLLRPFATMFAIICGVAIAQILFHLEIANVDLSFGGSTASLKKVEAKSAAAGTALVDINATITNLREQVRLLTEQVNALQTRQGQPAQPIPAAPESAGTASGDGTRASDTVAQLFKPLTGTAGPLAGHDGWVFVGNRTEGALELERPGLGSAATAPVGLDRLLPEHSLVTTANLVLRGALPANDIAYFAGQKNLGVLPRGTTVTLIATPVPIPRPSGVVQMWAHVHVPD